MAVFGEKDYQQLMVVKQMVADLEVPTEIVGRPIVREPDGLAMSSRNAYLPWKGRATALCLYRGMLAARELVPSGDQSRENILEVMLNIIQATPGARIDYAALGGP